MNLAGEMLMSEWKALPGEIEPSAFSIALPRLARRLPYLGDRRAFNIDRGAGRFLAYLPLAARQRRKHDFFHVVDHSYAHLVHVLPGNRTGVFCHDLDAFRPILGERDPRWSALVRTTQSIVLRGLRSARLVFYSTHFVREAIEQWNVVPSSRLIHAPYGIAPEYRADPPPDPECERIVQSLRGRRFLLHVGSNVDRKRLDVLFETFARLRPSFPELALVQAGADLTPAQAAHVARLGLEGQIVFAGRTSRVTLAPLYARAAAVLVTSDSEGFGLPAIEALACGAPLFASDIPVLREVGGRAAQYCRVGDPDEWAAEVRRFLSGEVRPPPLADRLARASTYSWKNHARTILDAYRSLD